MIFPVIPRPDKRQSSEPALPPVTNYKLPAMEETQFLCEREGEEQERESPMEQSLLKRGIEKKGYSKHEIQHYQSQSFDHKHMTQVCI